MRQWLPKPYDPSQGQFGLQLGEQLISGMSPILAGTRAQMALGAEQYENSREQLLKIMRQPMEDQIRREAAEGQLALERAQLDATTGYQKAQLAQDQAQFDAGAPYRAAQADHFGAQSDYLRAQAEGQALENKEMRTSNYGYEQPGQPDYDGNSANGIGFIGDNKLTDKAVALTSDLVDKLGAKPGALIAYETEEGKVGYGTFEDTTAKHVKGRIDIFDPKQTHPLANKPLKRAWVVRQGEDLMGQQNSGQRLRALAQENQKSIGEGAPPSPLAPVDISGTTTGFREGRTASAEASGLGPQDLARFSAPPVAEFKSFDDAATAKGNAKANIASLKSYEANLTSRGKDLQSQLVGRRELLKEAGRSYRDSKGSERQRWSQKMASLESEIRSIEGQQTALRNADQKIKEASAMQQTAFANAASAIDSRFSKTPQALAAKGPEVSLSVRALDRLESAFEEFRATANFEEVAGIKPKDLGLAGVQQKLRDFWSKQTGNDPAFARFNAEWGNLKLDLQSILKGTPSDADQEIINGTLPLPWEGKEAAAAKFAAHRGKASDIAIETLHAIRTQRSDPMPQAKDWLRAGVLTEAQLEASGLASPEQLARPTPEQAKRETTSAKLETIKKKINAGNGIWKGADGRDYIIDNNGDVVVVVPERGQVKVVIDAKGNLTIPD